VMVTKDPQSQDPSRIRALADEFGLRVGALHAPCLLITRKVWGTDPVAKIDRAVEAAADAEIPVVVVHPPYRWQRAFRRWLIDDLPGLEARTGVAVAVENMFPVRVAGRNVTFHANQDLDELDGLPHLVLDTSHAAVASPYEGAVSLEVDLRPSLGHGSKLADSMVDMRERVEASLAAARRRSG
jgi:sugar phosphate isomerase/epimerase